MAIPQTTPPPTPRNAGFRPARTIAGLLLITSAVFLMIEETPFRAIEAALTAPVVHVFTTGRSSSASSIIYFGLGTDHVDGITITTLCSTVILVTPLFALAGFLLMLQGIHGVRVIFGLAPALVLVIACNLARYAAAAFAMQAWGIGGFNVIHEYVGSLLVIFGFAAAFVLLLRISLRRSRRDAA